MGSWAGYTGWVQVAFYDSSNASTNPNSDRPYKTEERWMQDGWIR